METIGAVVVVKAGEKSPFETARLIYRMSQCRTLRGEVQQEGDNLRAFYGDPRSAHALADAMRRAENITVEVESGDEE